VGETLEDGWSPATPENDSLVRAYVVGFATMLTEIGRATGGRVLDDDDIVALDVGSEFFLANGAVLRHPIRDRDLAAVVERARDFYAAGTGVGWVLLSTWPLPPIPGMNLVGHPPFMVRPPGGEPPPEPPGLIVREAQDEAGMTDFARALAGYPATGTEVFANATLADLPGLRFFVGYLDDRPVACSAAHVTDACVDVEYVATHPEARGRGVGAALTWRATLADPSKPAVLIASDPGQAVYEKMGYLRLMRLTMWGSSPGR
jgi:GNAT superfamily N-acetyltransferase